MILTTSSDIPSNIAGHYDRNLLLNAQPERVHDLFGQIRPIPKNKGTQITFRYVADLAPALSPLSEGVTPAGSKLSTSTIYAELKQYGDFVTLSDLVSMTSLDPNILDSTDALGNQSGQTWDLLTRAQLVAGTSVRYANGVAARTSVDKTIQISDIKSVLRGLRGANAKPIKRAILPTTKVATVPIRAGFVCITEPDAQDDFEALPGFVRLENYPSQQEILPGEFGSIKALRCLSTTNAKVWADSGASVTGTGLVSTSSSQVDVYSAIVLAADAYGIVPLGSKNIQSIVKALGAGEDPLNQRATSGWKFAHCAKILRDDYMARIEFGVTSL